MGTEVFTWWNKEIRDESAPPLGAESQRGERLDFVGGRVLVTVQNVRY